MSPLGPLKGLEREKILEGYKSSFAQKSLEMMRAKLGLFLAEKTDINLIQSLEDNLQVIEIDMTIFFRLLSSFKKEQPEKGIELITASGEDTSFFILPDVGSELAELEKAILSDTEKITRKDELGGDNDDARYMTMEDGSVSMEREQLGQMASRQITFIDHLEKALMRIQNKTYGICRVTGLLIDKARLKAVPHATLSLEAKLGYVKSSSNVPE